MSSYISRNTLFQNFNFGESGFGINRSLVSGGLNKFTCRVRFMLLTNDDIFSLTDKSVTVKDKKEFITNKSL